MFLQTLFIGLLQLTLVASACDWCGGWFRDAGFSRAVTSDLNKKVWYETPVLKLNLYYISARLEFFGSYAPDQDYYLYRMVDAFVLNKNSQNPSPRKDYVLMVSNGAKDECGFAPEIFENYVRTGKRYVFKATSDVQQDTVNRINLSARLSVFLPEEHIDARGPRAFTSGSHSLVLRAHNCLGYDGAESLIWRFPEACVNGANCLSTENVEALIKEKANLNGLNNNVIAGIENAPCNGGCAFNGRCVNNECQCEYPHASDCSAVLPVCQSADQSDCRQTVTVSNIAPGAGEDVWLIGASRSIHFDAEVESSSPVRKFEAVIVNEDQRLCNDWFNADYVVDVSQRLRVDVNRNQRVHVMPQYLLQGNLCMNPGSNYRVRIRGLNAQNEPVTDWMDGEKFTVAESGCAVQHSGAVGVCTTRDLCSHRGYSVDLSPDCEYSTGAIVCCTPTASDGKSSWFSDDFEFKTPHGDEATIYSTDKLTVEWTFEAGLPTYFSLELVARDQANTKLVVARDVSVRTQSHTVLSFQAANRHVVGKHDLVAVFQTSTGVRRFSTPLELLPTPCATSPSSQQTLVGTCQTRGSCKQTVSSLGCSQLGAGVMCCFDYFRDNSYGFKDNANTLPDAAATNAVSLMLFSLCAVLAALF
eukprot:CAMPEP_0168584406 /NCGR_PEP_ID=MMETSP0420-20121227/3120_1 /TAXON_ID=498008 /ORGANISM="Pessonella sp." /LENGTH=642 /DNA_ID=CAMNT_0008619201 /DNA_START=116 /DNA_END=2044 /DNA_ORIENTATION=+